VSGVAHELNNPLMAIQGNAYVLLDDVEDEINRESLEVIYKETKRASEIVQNLLSFSRKQDSAKAQVDINECVDSIIKLRSYELIVNNIELRPELNPDLPLILGDSQRLRQVFLNLINNSAQAILQSKGKGSITIKTQLKTDQIISVVFEDDGPGIAPDVIERVFEPFFTTKDVGKGTGLGLSICYGIIQDHKGKIYAKSKIGKGATFVIEIPITSDVTSAPLGVIET
jgi:two-component system NtrC family sensor kinase